MRKKCKVTPRRRQDRNVQKQNPKCFRVKIQKVKRKKQAGYGGGGGKEIVGTVANWKVSGNSNILFCKTSV